MTDEAKQSEQSEGIAAKVDVGFGGMQYERSEVAPVKIPTWPKLLSAGVTTVAVQSNEMRLEALKLAYEVAFKVNSFNFPIEFNKKTQEEQQSDYEDVLALANINYQFIVSGKTNID